MSHHARTWCRTDTWWGRSPDQGVGLHGAQRVVHLDVVAVIRALLQLQRLEGQADDGVGVRPQGPVAERVVGVGAVGEARGGETGDLPFLGVEGKHAAICPGEQGRVNKEKIVPRLSPRCMVLVIPHLPADCPSCREHPRLLTPTYKVRKGSQG